MIKEEIISNEFLSLWYHPEGKIVHHKIHKFTSGDRFRGMLSKGLELFGQHKCTKWLSDDRNNSAVPPEDMEWVKSEWTPKMAKLGWKYWAILMPDKVIGKMNMQRHIEMHKKHTGVVVEIFDDEGEALKWLNSHN